VVSDVWVIVAHEDGRRFSVRSTDPRATCADLGWTVEGLETDAAFVATGIPKPKRGRRKPAAKDARPITDAV
jgi:hypothetical protein